jgi:hypothetical protein
MKHISRVIKFSYLGENVSRPFRLLPTRMELFQSSQKNGIFEIPHKFELSLNTGPRVMALFIAPDERYLILEVLGDRGYGGADLYVCYKM